MKRLSLLGFTCLLTIWPPIELQAAMSADEAAEVIARHDRAVHLMDDWMRDPYIVLAPDGWYYLTCTRLGNLKGGVQGIELWRSSDLAEWESLGTPWTYEDSSWIKGVKRPEGGKPEFWLWAPEIHFIDGRWVAVHTTNRRTANLILTEGTQFEPPFSEPLKADFGHRHDPSLFTDDDGSHWLVYACAKIQKMKTDFSGFIGPVISIGPSDRKLGHEGCVIYKIGEKYVLVGTAWSRDQLRKGTYNLYYCTANEVTGSYGPRKFAGRFLGHGTPFQDKQGRWWCTAFYNANKPTLTREQARTGNHADTAYTLNNQGLTIVPLDVRTEPDGDVYIRAKDPEYANPGPEEMQVFDRVETE